MKLYKAIYGDQTIRVRKVQICLYMNPNRWTEGPINEAA